jgi:hypothetical protein
VFAFIAALPAAASLPSLSLSNSLNSATNALKLFAVPSFISRASSTSPQRRKAEQRVTVEEECRRCRGRR